MGGARGRGSPRRPRRTHPEKAHFELPYRHHVLGTGPGRGSASSGARPPRPRRAGVLQLRLSLAAPLAEPPPRLFLGLPRPVTWPRPAPPGAPGLTPGPGSQERPQAASAAPGPAARLGAPPPSDQLRRWPRLCRARSAPASPAPTGCRAPGVERGQDPTTGCLSAKKRKVGAVSRGHLRRSILESVSIPSLNDIRGSWQK